MNAPVSAYLTQPPRTQAQASADRAEPFLTAPFWLVLVEPRRGEFYSLALDWPVMTNAARTLHEMRLSLGDEGAYVIRCDPDGTRVDDSAWFASLWLAQLKDEGFSRDEAMRTPFLSRHAEG